MSFLTRFRRSVFGYDLFISYARKDSLDYAYQISESFMAKGYACFIDQLSSLTPGQELPRGIKKAIRQSTGFILVGSPAAQQSTAVQ
jgi:hypothetical protein